MKLSSHVLTEKASDDIIKAVLWKESRHAGLGEKLLRCIDETINQICKSPHGYISRYRSAREKKVKTFSYQIIYTVEDKVIYIHAVFPCKQNPERKYKNL